MDSSSYGMMWGDWVIVAVVIIDRRSEGVAMAVELVGIGSMYSIGPCCEVPRGR